ncbi:MAG: DNA-formamidopyrimidine glycosylase family protein [Planctomycetota bacterium]
MPELPDVEAYLVALRERTLGQKLEGLRIGNPFLLRSVTPKPEALIGKAVQGFERLGKRIVFAFESDLFSVLHLMIAGRLHWRKPGAGLPGKAGLAAWDFETGSLVLTEAGSQRRASLHLVQGRKGLAEHARGGAEIDSLDLAGFARILRSENHTIKRSLQDPRLFSGIGNAYSDEILHRARLSPLLWTERMTDEQIATLFDATRAVLGEWRERLCAEARVAFPEKVTAFRPDMAVHGRYQKPCPVCGDPVQRIVYASRETNYCPTCQTGGKLLADRALSALLKKDWPRSLEELERHMDRHRGE